MQESKSMEFEGTSQLIEELGFPAITPVSSLRSISHLFGSTKKRYGIYLLVFESRFFYIGQAIDVVKRFSQHRLVHDDIVGFSFIPVRNGQLDEKEKSLIFRAESLGITLTNAIHVTNIVGDMDLDLIVSLEKQEFWLKDRLCLSNAEINSTKIILPEAQRVRFIKQFARFGQHPLNIEASELLKKYISSCIIAPRLTEYSFWCVSCMPGTNRNTWPRLFSVNAGVMELFVVGWHKSDPKKLWAFINVAEDTLHEYGTSADKLQEKFPHLKIVRRGYRDAGQNQVSLHINDLITTETILNDHSIFMAAGSLSLRVMRKRATIYGKYHCPQLVDFLAFDKHAE